MKQVIKTLGHFWGSWRGFALIVALFVVAAGYNAVRGHFPLPFDESYHFTLVNYYAHHWSPFITSQPDELATMGDATRMGSYLSHYILSFPLRFMQALGADQAIQVIALRFMNIGFAVGALIVFRLFLLRLINSGLVANLSILAYSALPVTTFLAGTINYDNPMLLCVALLLLISQLIIQRIKSGARLEASLIYAFLTTILIGSLVKFTFIPIGGMALLFVAVYFIKNHAWNKLDLSIPTQKMIRFQTIILMLVSMGSLGLVAERYGVNLIQYHSFQPDCSVVQSIPTCLSYSPWARNYELQQQAPNDELFEGRSFGGYLLYLWAPMMTKGMSYVGQEMRVYDPVTTSDRAVGLLFVLLAFGVVGYIIKNFRQSSTMLLLIVFSVYFTLLIQRNYTEFMDLHALIAVQGRYALPFIVPMAAVGLIGLAWYVTTMLTSLKDILKKIETLKTLEAREAYERSAAYWSTKVWRRSPEA